MNRKIIFGFTLCLMAIFAIGSVYAADFGSLLGGDENETVTIDGIDFNIPAGFKEDPTEATVNQQNVKGSITYITNGKLYEKGDVYVALLVADYGQYKVTDDEAKSLGGQKKTFNNVTGYVSKEGDYYSFYYPINDKLAIISANDENIISEFIME